MDCARWRGVSFPVLRLTSSRMNQNILLQFTFPKDKSLKSWTFDKLADSGVCRLTVLPNSKSTKIPNAPGRLCLPKRSTSLTCAEVVHGDAVLDDAFQCSDGRILRVFAWDVSTQNVASCSFGGEGHKRLMWFVSTTLWSLDPSNRRSKISDHSSSTGFGARRQSCFLEVPDRNFLEDEARCGYSQRRCVDGLEAQDFWNQWKLVFSASTHKPNKPWTETFPWLKKNRMLCQACKAPQLFAFLKSKNQITPFGSQPRLSSVENLGPSLPCWRPGAKSDGFYRCLKLFLVLFAVCLVVFL